MACHEIAALRLALMQVLGIEDEAERQHELDELGNAGCQPGPIQSLLAAPHLEATRRCYEAAVSELEGRVARSAIDDPSRPYLQTLVVLTKKVELDLDMHIQALHRLYCDLEQMHDFVHEIYPAE